MKKLSILIVFITISSITFGQFTTFTPKLGITYSNTPGFDKINYKPGFLFGVSTEYVLNRDFAIKPELLLEQKGCKGDQQLSDANGWLVGTVTFFDTWNYLTLPVQLQYSPFHSNIISFTAGGYAGYMLSVSERMKGEINGVSMNNYMKPDVSAFNRWDVGLNIGAGTAIPLGAKNKIEIAFKYEYAFQTDRFHLPPRTLTFSLSAGYVINIKK